MSVVRTVVDEFIIPYCRSVFGFIPDEINRCEPFSPKWRFVTGISWFFMGRSARAMISRQNGGIVYNPWHFGNHRLKNAIDALKRDSASLKQRELLGGLVFTLLHEAAHLYQPILGDPRKVGYGVWHEGAADIAAFILSSQLADQLQNGSSRFSSSDNSLGIPSESLAQCLSASVRKRAEDLSWALHAAPIKIVHHPPKDFIPPNSWITISFENDKETWEHRHAFLSNPRRWSWHRILGWNYAVGSLVIVQRMKRDGLGLMDIFQRVADSEVLESIK